MWPEICLNHSETMHDVTPHFARHSGEACRGRCKRGFWHLAGAAGSLTHQYRDIVTTCDNDTGSKVVSV